VASAGRGSRTTRRRSVNGQWYDSTAIRTYGHDVFVIDLDVTIAPVCEAILRAYEARWPVFMGQCLRRHSGAAKIALIGRCATVRRSFKSRRFFTGPEDESKGQLVETFGRADKKLVLVHGRHSGSTATTGRRSGSGR
jgi:hypothetical protein